MDFLKQSESYDPRNEDDYDTWDVGMEPLPNDHTWCKIKEEANKPASDASMV